MLKKLWWDGRTPWIVVAVIGGYVIGEWPKIKKQWGLEGTRTSLSTALGRHPKEWK